MRILQIAPPWYRVPPLSYGGIECVVADLVEGLIERGHDVTLLASGGSMSAGRLWSVYDTPPAHMIASPCHAFAHCVLGYRRRHEFDLIHDHTGIYGAAIASMVDGPPVVHTLHGAWYDDIRTYYSALPPRLHLVAISADQAARAPDAVRHVGVVHNGVQLAQYPMRSAPRGTQGYLCFVGRAHPDKGPDLAIRTAKRLRRHLKMMVKIQEPSEHRFWQRHCVPLLAEADVEVNRHASQTTKAACLAGADATLFPIRWDEPFGLVMAESMACGTPVVAYRRGAAGEVILDGHTGFVVEPGDDDAFANAVQRVGELSPLACRSRVKRLFSSQTLVEEYEGIYNNVLASPVTAAPSAATLVGFVTAEGTSS
jgi:glycosyltransferase involved in cell wall biosynthesis